ncbi:hypothetical protein AAFN86_11590 [Roseomonas sp. CAU 1739]|uniref:hypothetical protein n=1 Tax=Roseomonas sp. CAU 1739 TaxID=3140364 RepID=UPI00325ADA38
MQRDATRGERIPEPVLAEVRIGAELKAAQERGEVATQADHGAGIQASVRTADTRPATLPEIGIPRQRAAEMKKLAEVRAGFPGC